MRSEDKLPELAARLIGNGKFQSSPSLIRQLVAPDRGALGWRDLMLLHMHCSADVFRNVQNINLALLKDENPHATLNGVVKDIAVASMRKFSQKVFEEFKRIYIDRQVNFFIEVDLLTEDQILGEGGRAIVDGLDDIETKIQSCRAAIKSFVIYQLTNTCHGSAQGVGCGRYDESGEQDGEGIRRAMTDYLFGYCFDPSHGLSHAKAFADFCLQPAPFKITSPNGDDGPLYGVTDLLGQDALANFWRESRDQIRQLLTSETGTVYGYGKHKMTYADWLRTLPSRLDQLVISNTGNSTSSTA